MTGRRFHRNETNAATICATMSASCPGANASEGMERVKKLMSPGSKRRFLSGGTNKQFGTPLEELMRKHAHTSGVPTIVHRLCEYIEHFGLEYEGVFRVNGNVRVMDKLKSSFDTTGDADLEAEDDVAAAAGTLKQFLREMPEGVVPQSLTFKFIAIQQAHGRDDTKWLDLFRQVLCELPYDNYNLLRYLVRFLVLVTSREDQNKMSPMALGIVFGPGLFRTQGGVEALRYVGAINEIGQRIIMYYDKLFLEDSSEDMAEAGRSSGKKVPPPRPPPPKVQAQAEDVRPLPSPRKVGVPRRSFRRLQIKRDFSLPKPSPVRGSLTRLSGRFKPKCSCLCHILAPQIVYCKCPCAPQAPALSS